MKSRRPLLTLVLLVVALASVPIHAQNNQKPSVTPGDPHAVYVVVLNREKGAEPEFDTGGPRLLGRWSNRVVVELPPAALEAMRKHGRVKYVQHLITGPVTASTASLREKTASASLVARTLTGGGTLQWSTGDYHYDGSSNIDRIGADSDGQTRRFVYDEVDRLVGAGLEAPMAAPGTYTNYARYTYDSFGNRLSEVTPTINETVIADRNTNRVTLPGTIVTYDGVGNMTQGGGLMYQYDPFNNLKEVDNWSGVQKMAIYNAADERIIFCGDGSIGPCKWTLRGNGNEVLREYESGPIGNGNYWSYYLWVEDSVYRGRLLAGAQRETAEGGRLHFHLDHLGSPRLTTNATGQKVTANEFAPFGRELTSITQEAQLGYDRTETHRFTGHERDFVEGTGSDTVNFIDYMHARSYTTVFGRFLSVDPLIDVKHAIQAPQMWNRYAYVQNNPSRYTDPLGLFMWGSCSGTEEQCEARRERFRASIENLKKSASELKEGSKERTRLEGEIKKLGDEGTGNIKIDFGYAGTSAAGPNLGLTIGNRITINYDAADKTKTAFNLNASEAAAADAGLTAHEVSHAGSGRGLFGLLGMHGEKAAYTNESITYQGLHNTDRVYNLWSESWLALSAEALDRKRQAAVDENAAR